MNYIIPHSFELNSTTTVLQGWVWHLITQNQKQTNTPLLPLLPGLLPPEVVVPVMVPSMVQVSMFENYLYQIEIPKIKKMIIITKQN